MLAFHCGLIQKLGVLETKNKNRGCSLQTRQGFYCPALGDLGFGCLVVIVDLFSYALDEATETQEG